MAPFNTLSTLQPNAKVLAARDEEREPKLGWAVGAAPEDGAGYRVRGCGLRPTRGIVPDEALGCDHQDRASSPLQCAASPPIAYRLQATRNAEGAETLEGALGTQHFSEDLPNRQLNPRKQRTAQAIISQ